MRLFLFLIIIYAFVAILNQRLIGTKDLISPLEAACLANRKNHQLEQIFTLTPYFQV